MRIIKDWNREQVRDEYKPPEIDRINFNVSTGGQPVAHYQFQENSGNPSGLYRINPLIQRAGIIVLEEDWETSSAINPDIY